MSQRTRCLLRYLFVVVLGSALHFVYELSGENLIVGLFAPVNESVWEHLKLIFFPMLILTLWDVGTNRGDCATFLPARTTGILLGMTFIVVTFYTITGILGTNIDWINILIYFLAVAFAFWTEMRLYRTCECPNNTISILILIIFVILFVVFTLAPPAIGIFIPPVG